LVVGLANTSAYLRVQFEALFASIRAEIAAA
jgi:hypothetical protein